MIPEPPPPPKSPLPSAPPKKKQRASNTPFRLDTGRSNRSSNGTSSGSGSSNGALKAQSSLSSSQTHDYADPISKRRAELTRLQQRREGWAISGIKGGEPVVALSTENLLARARSALPPQGSGPPPIAASLSTESRESAPSMPKAELGISRVRHSDIFPSVPKASSSRTAVDGGTKASAPPPMAPPAPTPGVARRLDASFESAPSSPASGPQNKEATTRPPRSKSAPPTRLPAPVPPPPPPLPPAIPVSGSTTAAAAPLGLLPVIQPYPDGRRDHARRPPPLTPMTYVPAPGIPTPLVDAPSATLSSFSSASAKTKIAKPPSEPQISSSYPNHHHDPVAVDAQAHATRQAPAALSKGSDHSATSISHHSIGKASDHSASSSSVKTPAVVRASDPSAAKTTTSVPASTPFYPGKPHQDNRIPEATPSTVRRDMLRTMREHANTPPTFKKEPPAQQQGPPPVSASTSQPQKQVSSPSIPPITKPSLDGAPPEATVDMVPASARPEASKLDLQRLERERRDTMNTMGQLHDGMKQLERQMAVAETKVAKSAPPVTVATPPQTPQPQPPQQHQLLQAVLQMADTDGEAAALKWARQLLIQQQSEAGDFHLPPTAQVSFFSPVAHLIHSPGSRSGMGPPVVALGSSSVMRKPRVATPHPRRYNPASSPAAKANEEEDRHYWIQAVDYVPFEYTSHDGQDILLATFVIRRPFGMATEQQLWFEAGQLGAKLYEKSATVVQADSLEVLVTIAADGSFFVVHGTDDARHKRPASTDWNEFDNVDEREKPLGVIPYIDADANEKEYSLDDIYQGALSVREQYCASIISTAVALRIRNETQPPATPLNAAAAPTTATATAAAATEEVVAPVVMSSSASVAPPQSVVPKRIVVDKAVGTEDLKFVPPATQGDERVVNKSMESKPTSVPPPIPDDQGPDAISMFMLMVVSSIVGLLWTIFIRIPIRILSTMFYLAMAYILLSVVHLYLANDHGAETMMSGGSMPMYFNQPGIM